MSSVFFLILFSCEKESFNDSNTKKTKGFKILSYSGGENSRGIENNILSFDNEDEYYATLDSLESAYNKYSDEFTEQVNGMTDEAINNKVESEGIDLEKTLTDFEKQYNFVSLRNSIDDKEKTWLQNPNPDFITCPQIHSISSLAERCLWNNKGEIMISGKIFKYDQDDIKYIEIKDGDFLKLAQINAGSIAVLSDPNVSVSYKQADNTSTTVMATNSLNCTSQNGNLFTTPLGGYQVVCSNRLLPKSWFGGKHSLSAGTVAYKKVGDFYSRYITLIQTDLYGERYRDCGDDPALVQGLSRHVYNSSLSVELKRNYKISTKYNNSFSSINSHHGVGNPGVAYFPPFEANYRLKY